VGLSSLVRLPILSCVLLSFLLLPRPPSSPLFPYTTLFRSSFFTFILPMWVIAVGIVFTVSVTANGALADFDEIAGSAVAFYFCIDRKSTRLNSSHVKNSYAVFCLKKKKKVIVPISARSHIR